jgi:2-keto-4-pentenoate hydratase/2-oxohepta-3-ene-1,7-dioic acid hydratase in catechol pathway
VTLQYVRFETAHGARWGQVEQNQIVELDGAPYAQGQATDQVHALDGIKLLAPVEPTKIICIGRNYADHAAELGNQAPAEPMFFLKAPSTLIGTGDAIQIPYPEHAIHWEAELAVVIGRPAKNVTQAAALDYIFGYTIANDISDRDYQKGDIPFGFGRGKSFDTFLPCGPMLVTEGIDPFDSSIELTCNDVVRQSDRTHLMVHNVPKLISFLSAIMTLMPGDLVLTGTPKGVGAMKSGDVVAVTIPGIGTLTNPVA